MSNHLTHWRKAQNMTAQKAADLLGVDRTTLWRWESGAYSVPASRLRDVSVLTGLPVQALRPDIFAPSMRQDCDDD